MRDRLEQALRLACVVLGALLLFQIGRIVAHRNPLSHLQIPALPTLAAADAQPGAKATNAAPVQDTTKKSTNSVAGASATKETNAAAAAHTTKGATNPSPEQATRKAQTNSVTSVRVTKDVTNSTPDHAAQKAETNSVAAARVTKEATNSTPERAVQKAETNSLALPQAPNAGTNSLLAKNTGKMGSNSVAQTAPIKPGSNSVPQAEAMSNNPTQRSGPNVAGRPPGLPGPPGLGAKPRELRPDVWARVDRITDSEILGPVMRPLPMGLLGIAGNIAFLRAANGQTGLVKEGDELGGLKLLRIGINRVLVEQEGQKKELMIFSGFGGESLLPK